MSLVVVSSALEVYVKQHSLGAVYVAPIDVILPGKLGDPVQPDIICIRRERLHIVGETYIEGAPDLVLEVLSPSNPDHDRGVKFAVYAEAGVHEYWIIDPRQRTVELSVLRRGAYELLGHFGEDETTRSEALDGFSIFINEMFPA